MRLPPRFSPAANRSIESRLTAIEDEMAIRDLAARYNFLIDNRDLDAVRELFTEQSSFGSKDGVMNATGRDAILKQFEGRFAVLGVTNHFAHDHLVWFDSQTSARGVVNAHAEMWRLEQPMIAALRYEDLYEKTGGLWRFAQRLLSCFYYLNIKDYSEALGRLERNMAGPTPAPADHPELLATYTEMRPGRVKPSR